MPIDYASADLVLELSFRKLDSRHARLNFPAPGSLAAEFKEIMRDATASPWLLPHNRCHMLASAGVEMWHRAIHSFLCSVSLAEASPIWSSVAGYYASHYVMRAFAHSLGFFKSFVIRKNIQILPISGQFECTQLTSETGEHGFYWKVVKGHPRFVSDPLFRENIERENSREQRSDAIHRNFANYTDHINSFTPVTFPSTETIADRVERISTIRRGSIITAAPQRGNFPDTTSVQVLALQRIVAYQDFLDDLVPRNRFWRAHRRPAWCEQTMTYDVDTSELEAPLSV